MRTLLKISLALSLVFSALGSEAFARSQTVIASNLKAAIGQAYYRNQGQADYLYFAEWSTGRVRRLNLSNNKVKTIQKGLGHPEDVVVNAHREMVFVTTREGKIYSMDLDGQNKTVAASDLGQAHQLYLNRTGNFGYVTDRKRGVVHGVNLLNGGSFVSVENLDHPIGLLVKESFTELIVAEPDRILKINTISKEREVLADGFKNAFYMDWATPAQESLYVVERDPRNRLTQVDLGNTTDERKNVIMTNLPWRTSSVVVGENANTLYVAGDKKIVEVSTVIDPGTDGPLITRLGHIPSTEIDSSTGLATTDPDYFFQTKNSSFGGSIRMFLNFSKFRNMGATHYKVFINGESNPLKAVWRNYKWNGTEYVLERVSPDTQGAYSVPAASEQWSHPNLGFVLNTRNFENKRHKVTVRPYKGQNPMGESASVTLAIDNNAPTVKLDQIIYDGRPLNECALITEGEGKLKFQYTAFDPEGHLLRYNLRDLWGKNRAQSIKVDNYSSHSGSTTWTGVEKATTTYVPSNTKCSHQFRLSARGNTTNGYSYIHRVRVYDHVAVFLGSSLSCQ